VKGGGGRRNLYPLLYSDAVGGRKEDVGVNLSQHAHEQAGAEKKKEEKGRR